MFFKKDKHFDSNIDYIIIGLGNPGREYESTRHNAGFMVIDELAARKNVKVKQIKFKSLYCPVNIGTQKCILCKPQTFMNNSGETVRDIIHFYKVPIENVIVIYDEILLDVGMLRIRRSGSHGGHNGLKSIQNLTSSEMYARIKIGVGDKPHPEYDLANWVLSNFTKAEGVLLEQSTDKACSAVELIVNGEIDKAMNDFNAKN